MQTKRSRCTALIPSQIDFSAGMKLLGPNIELAMASLYSLEMALNNLGPSDKEASKHWLETFKNIRNALKMHWESILKFLQACLAFNVDVEDIKNTVAHGDIEGLEDALHDLNATCSNLVMQSSGLLHDSDNLKHEGQRHASKFTQILRDFSTVHNKSA